MNISKRALGHILASGAFAAACFVGTGQLRGQATIPVNPLRQPQRIAETVGPALTMPETSRTPSEDLAPPPPAKNLPPAHEPRTVRQTSYGAPTTARRPASRVVSNGGMVGTAVSPRTTHPTSVLAEPAPEVMPGPQISSPSDRVPRDGEIIYEGVFDPTMSEPGLMGGEVIGPELAGCARPCITICFDNLEIYAGVQGFTGPMNRGGTGSFGFNEGLNWGFPLPFTCGSFGGQIGMRATQSNLSGAEFTDSIRNQIFMTGGVFRRVDWGMQGGVVLDYMSQDWYSATDLLQMRGEASWVFPCMHELGFWFTSGTGEHTAESELLQPRINRTLEAWESTDLFAFFYRRRFEETNGAEARWSAGFSGDGDGYIGADIHIPVGTNWALDTNFAYLIPHEASGSAGNGYAQESWNIGINVVWYPGCQNFCGPDYFRPLFRVADNGTFMVGAPTE